MKKKAVTLLLALCAVSMLPACGKNTNKPSDVSVSESTVNPGADTTKVEIVDVMTIRDYTVKTSDLYLYLILYTSMNGIQNDQTLEGVNSLIKTVLNQVMMEQVQYQMALAEDCEISEEDRTKAKESTQNFITFFGKDFLGEYGITEEQVEQMFIRSAYENVLSAKTKEKMYDDLYKQIEEEYASNPLHSVTYAVFPTLSFDDNGKEIKDENGKVVYLSEEEKLAVYDTAAEFCARAKAGEDFNELIEEYNIAKYSGEEHEFDGAYTEELNDLIAGLQDGDISDIQETPAGYMIVRMDNRDDVNYKAYLVGYAAKQQAEQAYFNMKDIWAQNSGISMSDADKDAIEGLQIVSLLKEMGSKGLAVYGKD